MTTRPDNASIADLMSTALEQVSALFRTEIKLAQAELTEKVTSAGIGVGMIAAAGLMAIPALVLVLMAVAALLVHFGMNVALADLLAAILGFAVCAALVMMGLNRLRAQSMMPEHAFKQVKRDAVAIKEHVS